MSGEQGEKNAQNHPNAQRAATFFTQHGLSRLLAKLRDKYIEVGVGGQIRLEDSTASERREIASFLGKPAYRDAAIKVRLVDVDTALRQSGFACTLPDLLSACFPDQPLVTRQEQRAAHAVQQANFRQSLSAIAAQHADGSRAHSWLAHGAHGLEWLFSRYKNADAPEQERQLALVHYIADALDQLPTPDAPERLALFAQRTSGDPHALDPNRAAGRLFLLALHDLAGAESPALSHDRALELDLYNAAGLLVDTISSSVAIFNLAGAYYSDGTADVLVQVAGRRVLLLPLRQVLEWRHAQPATARIYVFENPQVFEEVIAGLPIAHHLPTLVCTSGWPSVAALRLLDLLVAEAPGNRLYYNGDIDLKGLQIAAHLMARYPRNCHLWRIDPHAYVLALQADGVPAPASDLAMLNTLPTSFAPLVAAMQEKKKWAYQEGIAHVLLDDICREIGGRDEHAEGHSRR
jgi:uncharacterized protein (TIGR02679 family)